MDTTAQRIERLDAQIHHWTEKVCTLAELVQEHTLDLRAAKRTLRGLERDRKKLVGRRVP